MASNTENVSIWWRHRDKPFVRGTLWSLVDSWSPMDSPHKGQVILNFEFLFNISLHKLLYKRSSCRWFGKPWSPWDNIIINLCYKWSMISLSMPNRYFSIDTRDQLAGLAISNGFIPNRNEPGCHKSDNGGALYLALYIGHYVAIVLFAKWFKGTKCRWKIVWNITMIGFFLAEIDFSIKSIISLSTIKQQTNLQMGLYSLSGKTSYRQIVKSRGREIGCYNDLTALKSDKHLTSAATEVPVTFQSD